MENIYLKKAELFKALSNPIRLEIIDLLIERECCVCEIISKLEKYEQSHISKNLSILKRSGIIKSRKIGLNVHYSISMECIKNFMNCLNKNLTKE